MHVCARVVLYFQCSAASASVYKACDNRLTTKLKRNTVISIGQNFWPNIFAAKC